MGRLIGSFMDDNELDRPDLNKCPDCECYFPQDNCPICGKECPPEMRAGNRKVQKVKKSRNGRSTQRVVVDWYHRWWFIILMLFVFPLLGFILLLGSPHSKKLKITVAVIAALYTVLPYLGYGIPQLINIVGNNFDRPVDTSLTYEEYKDKCEELRVDEFFRNPELYKGSFVKTTLTVESSFFDVEGEYNGEKYNDYYVCTWVDGQEKSYSIILRQCVVDGIKNLTPGDRVTVYGQCGESVDIFDSNAEQYRRGPCINGAYFEIS